MPISKIAGAQICQPVVLAALAWPWLNPFAFGPSAPVLQSLFSLVAIASLLLLLAWRVAAATLPTLLAGAWLLAAVLSSLIAIVQYLGYSGHLAPWVNATAVGEAFANLRQRNQFATLTSIGLVLLLWAPLPDRWMLGGELASRGIPGWARRYWPHAAAMLLAVGNAASSSRTGLVQLLLLVPLTLLWNGTRNRSAWQVLVAALVAYAAATFLLPALLGLDPLSHGIASRFRAETLPCGSRLILWSNVLQLIAQKPWLGWGWGELDYAHFINLYPGPRFCEILDNAHNLPLHLAVELGVPFALLCCSTAAWLVWRARPWREAHPARRMAWAVLAMILLHSMLEYPLWYGPFQLAVGLCFWVLWSTRLWAPGGSGAQVLAHNAPSSTDHSPFTKAASTGIAVILPLCAAYAAWDYHRISQIYLPVKSRSAAYREDTLEKIQASWLFRNQVRFANLTTTELTPQNAAQVNTMAHELLHFSPEGRVVEKLIESAVMLGRDDEALAYSARYRAAFPSEYKLWTETNRVPPTARVPLN